jgi:hypothetical protein
LIDTEGCDASGVADMLKTQIRNTRIAQEEIHDVLRNDRRRWTLQYLKQCLDPVDVRELSEKVAAMEIGKTPPPRDVRRSVYNALNQTHLPKLDEVGLVKYDRDRKTVVLCEDARDADIYMNIVSPVGITWGAYYRTLGVFGLFAVVVADANVALLADIDSLLFATAFLIVFLVSMIYQLWTQRWFYLHMLFSD